MSHRLRNWLIWLTVVFIVMALRLACVFYQRSGPAKVRPISQRLLDKDSQVVIPRFYANDLGSARQLAGKTLWVKAGYRATYFPWKAQEKAKPCQAKLFFEPMESFVVEEVMDRPMANRSQDREVLFLFRKGEQIFATTVGFYLGKEQLYQVRIEELFFPKNPIEIYPHWSPQTWEKIKAHQLEKGMTFAQVGLSIGDGQFITTEAGGSQLYEFGRKPGGDPGKIRVRFVDGKVEEVEIRE
jgi:hypothetical protein